MFIKIRLKVCESLIVYYRDKEILKDVDADGQRENTLEAMLTLVRG